MKIKFLVLILISILFLSACKPQQADKVEVPMDIVIEEATPKPTPTPIPEPLPIFEDFDCDYKNLITKESSIAFCGKKVYYIVDNILYCYNFEIEKKIKIDKDLVSTYIYSYGGYIYYLKEKSFKRINIETDKMEWIFNAGEICRASIPNSSGANQQLRYFYMTDNFVSISCRDIEKGAGDPSGGKIYANIDEWELYTSLESIKSEFAYKRINNETGNVGIRYTYQTMNNSEKKIITAPYYIYIEDNRHFLSGYEVLSGDKLYITDWPQSGPYILGYRFDTDERIFEKYIVDSYTKLFALNQYVFGYYYGNRENEVDERGVLLIDTKNDIVYENEEINQVISGDIDYTNLYHTNYYYDGQTLYVLEEAFDEVENKNLDGKVNIYRAEIIDGKLHFTQIYKEFEK